MGRGLWHSISTSGLLLGTLFFAASLTPTLLPRSFSTQGVLSGFSLAAGYGIGVFGRWLWTYMELPQPKGGLRPVVELTAATGCAVVAVIFLCQAAGWRNSIRALMDLEPVDTAHALEVALIALAVFAILMALAALPVDAPICGDESLTASCRNGCPTSLASSRRLHCSGRSSVEFCPARSGRVLPGIRQADRTGH
jgi:uncharacterized membrane protein